MPIRLIYRGSRLRGQGYVTITSGGEHSTAEKAGIELYCQSVLKGQPKPGSTGVLRKLSFEGRQIDEILVFHHGRHLTHSQVEALQAELGRLFDSGLAAALAAVNASGQDAASARASVREALDRFLTEISRALPISAPAVELSAGRPHSAKPGLRGWSLPVISLAILVLLALAGVGVLFVSGAMDGSDVDATDSNTSALQPTAKGPVVPVSNSGIAIAELVTACWPTATPEVIEGLKAVYADRNIGSYDSSSGRRDRFQLIDQQGRHLVRLDEATDDKSVCERRNELWMAAQRLREARVVSGVQPPYRQALQAVGLNADKFELVSVANKAWSHYPLPDTPEDCARGYCLPIYDPADIGALRVIDNTYRGIAEVLSDDRPSDEIIARSEKFADAYEAKLRQAEIIFRGELALAGEPMPRIELLKQFWNCEGREHRDACAYPLLGVREKFPIPPH